MKAENERIRLSFIFSVLMICVAVDATFHPLPPADLWIFMAMARYILSTLSFPQVNFFSYTAPDYPIIDHEWIPGIFFYGLHAIGGMVLLYIVKTAIIVITFVILYRLAIRRGTLPVLSSLAVIVCIVHANGNLYFDVRPYLFTYLFVALFLYVLDQYSRSRDLRMIIAIPPLIWIWVNSHGAFVLSFVLLSIYIVTLCVRNASEIRSGEKVDWRQMKEISAVMVISAALTFLNPYGTRLLLYPFSFLKESFYKSHLVEWAPPELFGTDLPFLIFFIVTTLAVLIFHKRLTLFDKLCYLFFGYLAFSAVRHITLFCIVNVPVVALMLQCIYEKLRDIWTTRITHGISPALSTLLHKQWLKEGICYTALSCILLFYGMRFSSVDINSLSMESALFPRHGVQFLEQNRLNGPLYNPYEWGGYLIWKLYPQYKVFIDGRVNNAYPENIYRESLAATSGRPGWEKILNHYRINLVFINKFLMESRKGYRLGYEIDKSPSWKLVYEDRVERLFIRRCRENEDIISRAESGRLYIPESAWQLEKSALKEIERGNPAEARTILRKALILDATYTTLYVQLGFCCYVTGELNEGKSILQEGLKRDRTLYLAHDLLGRIYLKEGRTEKAVQEFREALKIKPDFVNSRKSLEELQNKKIELK